MMLDIHLKDLISGYNIVFFITYCFQILISFLFFFYFEKVRGLIHKSSFSKLFFNKKKWIILVTLFCLIYLFSLLYNKIETDITGHSEIVLKMVEGKMIVGHFLFFLTVYVFSFFQKDLQTYTTIAVIIISLMITLKFFLANKIFFQLAGLNKSDDRTIKYTALINLLSLSLIFISNLPSFPFNAHFYIGQITPNVWHNSTIIFLMPFALLLVYYTYKFFEDEIINYKIFFVILLLIFLNIATKPSYIFVYLISFPVFSFLRFKFSGKTILSVIISIIALLLIYIQYKLIYTFNSDQINLVEKASIAIMPFKVWSYYTSNIPVVLLFSLAFPISYLVFYFNRFKKDLFLQFSWFSLFLGLIIFSLFAETGDKMFHGNFGWQNIVCSFILFLVTLSSFIRLLLERKSIFLKDKLIMTIYICHFIAGIIYMIKTISWGYN